MRLPSWLCCAVGVWACVAALQGVAQPGPLTIMRSAHAEETINAAPHTLADGKGGLIVVFKSTRPQDGYANLVAQRVDANGQLAWEQTGVLLSATNAHQDNAQVAPDGAGGAIVVWEDEQPAGGTRSIRLQHLGADGQPTWGLQGLPASPSVRRQHNPQLAADFKGGIYCCWEEEDVSTHENLIYCQHFTTEGKALWPAGGKLILRQQGLCQQVQLAAAPGQGVILVWEDFRSGKKWELYAQQLTTEGDALWPDGGLSLSSGGKFTQRYASIFPDGFGGMVCIYEGLGGLSFDKDLYMLRVSRSGQVVYQQPVCVRTADQTHPSVIKRGGDAWVCWEDYRTGQPVLYLQRMDITTGLMGFSSQGMRINGGQGPQLNPKLRLVSLTGEMVVAWEKPAGGHEVSLQKLSPTGEARWAPDGLSTSSELWAPGEVDLVGDERGGAWLCWVNRTKAGQLPRVQAFNAQGRPRLANTGITLIPAAQNAWAKIERLTSAPGYHQDAYLAWEDYRAGEKEPDIYLQRIRSDGTTVWQRGGVPACNASGRQSLPTLLPVPGGVVVGWLDRRGGADENLYLQYFDTLGRAHWPAEGLLLCDAPKSQSSLRLAYLQEGNLLAAWADARDFTDTGFDIYLQKISLQGKPLWAPNGMPFITQPGYQTSPVLVADPEGGAYLAWADERNGPYNIYLQRINAAAQLQWHPAGVRVSPSTNHQRQPTMALTPGGMLALAWAEEPPQGGSAHLYWQAIKARGGFLWGNVGRQLCAAGVNQTNPLLRTVGDELVASWLDERQGGQEAQVLFSQNLGNNGNPRWDAAGVRIGAYLPENAAYDALFLPPQGKGYYLWRENVGGQPQVSYARLGTAAGQVLMRAPVQPAVVGEEQDAPQLLRLGPGKVAALWLTRNAAAKESSIQLLHLP